MSCLSNDNNPWLGLRTYSEGQYMYGRFKEIDALTRDISLNRQTIVYGKSGIGKSSLLNAGVFPRLRKAKMFPVNIRLIHDAKGEPYISQISAAIADGLNHLRRESVDEDGKTFIKENLEGKMVETCALKECDGNETLWEYFHRHRFFDDRNEEIYPVIVIDQFEEIFTLCKSETQKMSFFSELADLINDVPPNYIFYDSVVKGKRQSDKGYTEENENVLHANNNEFLKSNKSYIENARFHLVVILREDFLSYFERYVASIPLLKHNRFCLLPLDYDQAMEVIVSPVRGLISKNVAEAILSKVTNQSREELMSAKKDSIIEVDTAILSLFLSELYSYSCTINKQTITEELVNNIGDDILSSFYERTISFISEESAVFLEKSLITDNGDYTRRDSIFESTAIQNGVSKEELEYLKENLLIHDFPWNNDVRIEFIHDILCKIIKRRKEKRNQQLEIDKDSFNRELKKLKIIARDRNRQSLLQIENVHNISELKCLKDNVKGKCMKNEISNSIEKKLANGIKSMTVMRGFGFDVASDNNLSDYEKGYLIHALEEYCNSNFTRKFTHSEKIIIAKLDEKLYHIGNLVCKVKNELKLQP